MANPPTNPEAPEDAGVGAGRTAGKSSHNVGTGTVAWFYRIMIECLFGLRSGFDGLHVDPQLPAAWDRASIRLPYRGAVYDVEIRKERAARKTVVTLDGQELEDNRIPPPVGGGRHRVAVMVSAFDRRRVGVGDATFNVLPAAGHGEPLRRKFKARREEIR